MLNFDEYKATLVELLTFRVSEKTLTDNAEFERLKWASEYFRQEGTAWIQLHDTRHRRKFADGVMLGIWLWSDEGVGLPISPEAKQRLADAIFSKYGNHTDADKFVRTSKLHASPIYAEWMPFILHFEDGEEFLAEIIGCMIACSVIQLYFAGQLDFQLLGENIPEDPKCQNES